MTFPNYPNKHEHDSLLTAADIVAYRRHLGRMPDADSLKGLLFCLERGLPRRLRRQVWIRKAGSMLGDLYLVRRTGKRVGVMDNFGGGAPIVAELAEELVAMGVERLILMTWGGTLQPDLAPGDVVVCDRAIRDDGTSHHYLPPAKTVSASPELAQCLANAIRARGVKCTIGTTWTTDAPYRETPQEVAQYQKEGVKTVEMESSALFTIGQVRQVQTVSAVVVMDSLANMRWEVPERIDKIQHSLETVYKAAVDVLREYKENSSHE
jgi:uridine phosphorylase